MLFHALLTFYRSLARHRLYAALNVFGLAFGIAVFLVLTLVVGYENGFDRWIPNASNVYRVDTIRIEPGQMRQEFSTATFVALDPLRADYPQIQAGTRTMDNSDPVSVGHTIDSETVTYVDPSFLDVIELPLLSGERHQALSLPTSVVITESIAKKYFGTVQAFGKTLDIDHEGTKRSYTVSGVLKDLPHDTTLVIHLLVPLTPALEEGTTAFQRWGSTSGSIFLRFRNRADALAVGASLRDFVARRAAGAGDDKIGTNPADRLALSLVALPDAHFHDVLVDATVPGVDRRIVLSLGLVGVLALIMAAINYINLATARSGLRAREVALRKVMGATHRMLMVQFLGEAVALVALAALVGLALAEVAIPLLNSLGGWSVAIDYRRIVPLLALLVVVVGLGAGIYPSMLLAAYRPASVLASARTPTGGRAGMRLRNLLVLMQFVSAIAFAICTLVIDAQASFLRNADRGFDRQGLIIVEGTQSSELLSRQNVIMDALRRVPGVVAATLSDREPDSASTNMTGVGRPGLVGPAPSFVFEKIGRDYDRTYRTHLVAGRLFDDTHRLDDMAGQPLGGRILSTILNERAVAILGFRDPRDALGKTVGWNGHRGKVTLEVIGVRGDVRFMSPREPVAPQFYLYDTHDIDSAQAAIRFAGVPRAEMMRRLQAAWRGVVPDTPFVAKTADERLADFYQPDQQRARLFSAGAVLAIAIACVGLYGLASFNTARRVREIGIRKVLGASTRDVLLLLVGQFIRPVLIANVIAWPIAWVAMQGWLAGFDQRIALSPGYFVAATVAALAISILTVLGQAWRVARAEPGRALRYE
ncbi:MAG: ABC transporter permease [Janthinobacterium lividum]